MVPKTNDRFILEQILVRRIPLVDKLLHEATMHIIQSFALIVQWNCVSIYNTFHVRSFQPLWNCLIEADVWPEDQQRRNGSICSERRAVCEYSMLPNQHVIRGRICRVRIQCVRFQKSTEGMIVIKCLPIRCSNNLRPHIMTLEHMKSSNGRSFCYSIIEFCVLPKKSFVWQDQLLGEALPDTHRHFSLWIEVQKSAYKYRRQGKHTHTHTHIERERLELVHEVVDFLILNKCFLPLCSDIRTILAW